MYILFILFYVIWRMKLCLCSQRRDLHHLRCLLCVPRQYFTLLPRSTPPIVERTEEQLTSALHSRSIFPFWWFARGEGNIMSFLTTPDYLDSLLPSEQRSLKNKTSAKLLLPRGSRVAVLAKSNLAHFSISPLLSYTCSFPLTHQTVNTLPQILSECVQLSVRTGGMCRSWFCCFMYSLWVLFNFILFWSSMG